MVSQTTLEKIAKVLRRNVSEEKRLYIVRQLQEVPGNKSFRDTINALELLLLQKDLPLPKLRQLICGCMSDGSAVCPEHDPWSPHYKNNLPYGGLPPGV